MNNDLLHGKQSPRRSASRVWLNHGSARVWLAPVRSGSLQLVCSTRVPRSCDAHPAEESHAGERLSRGTRCRDAGDRSAASKSGGEWLAHLLGRSGASGERRLVRHLDPTQLSEAWGLTRLRARARSPTSLSSKRSSSPTDCWRFRISGTLIGSTAWSRSFIQLLLDRSQTTLTTTAVSLADHDCSYSFSSPATSRADVGSWLRAGCRRRRRRRNYRAAHGKPARA